jgi:hypothetical protein
MRTSGGVSDLLNARASDLVSRATIPYDRDRLERTRVCAASRE